MTKLSKKQLKEVKEQLLSQIDSFPKDQQETMKNQMKEMNDDQLEEFLIKNKLINVEGDQQSPFRMIIEGKLPSFKIAENDKALAVLEINPISKGHIMIIPKIPYKASEIPEEIQRFAQLLSSHLQKILNPTKIDIGISEAFEEGIINVLPIYKEETFKSKRKKAEEKELADLQVELTLPPEKPQTEVIKMDSEPEEEEEPEEKKKKRKTPINRLKKAPKRQP